MGTETQILSGSVQYNDFKGEVGIDEHMPEIIANSPLYTIDAGKVFIGWQLGKYDYNSSFRIKILSVDEEKIIDGELEDDAVIYRREINISAEDFLSLIGRIEITALRRSMNSSFGQEFTFDYED